MLFMELAMQGVGAFAGTTRIGLRQGLNLITGGNESGKTTIYNCLFSFLNTKHTDSKRLINWDGPEASRAALIFKSKDGETYKVVQDYLKGQVAAFKFNPSSDRFDLLDKGDAWLAGFLTSELGGLADEEMEHIFGLQDSTLLSITSRINNASKSTPAVSKGSDKDFKEKRLKELKEMLKKAEELSQLECRMDEIQNKIRDLGKKLDDFNTIEEKLGTISKELDQLKTFADLSANVPELISAYKKREQEKVDALRRFEEDRLILEEDLAKIPSKPIYQNKIFLIGGGIAVLSNVIIFSMNLPAMVKPLYLIAFLSGLGMVGYELFKEIQLNTARSEKEEKVKALNMEMRKFMRKYEKDNMPFLEILKKTSSQDAADLRNRYKNYNELLEIKGRLEGERGRIFEGREKKAIEEEHQSLQTLRQELHDKISGCAGVSANVYEIQEEVERLETELSSHGEKAKDTRVDEAIAGKMDAEPPFVDMKRILGKDFIGLFQRISEEVGKNMARLSSGRCEHLDMGEDSHICLSMKGSRKKVTPSMLSSGVLAQLYLSIRLALFSVLASRVPFPFILDNPLILLDPRCQLSAVELLREVCKDKQIILFTSHNYPSGAEDHLVRL